MRLDNSECLFPSVDELNDSDIRGVDECFTATVLAAESLWRGRLTRFLISEQIFSRV